MAQSSAWQVRAFPTSSLVSLRYKNSYIYFGQYGDFLQHELLQNGYMPERLSLIIYKDSDKIRGLAPDTSAKRLKNRNIG
jgi:hypothetical protein